MNLISRPGPWSCEITLRFEYDTNNAPLKEVSNIAFGPPLTSNEDVEVVLMRAQAAVLNYPSSHTDFLTKDRNDLEYYRSPAAFSNGTAKFSRNSVCLKVYDEECPDLSFVDLPGL